MDSSLRERFPGIDWDAVERRKRSIPSHITERRVVTRTIRGERDFTSLAMLSDYTQAHETIKLIDKDRYRGGSGYKSGQMRGARR